MSDSANEVLIVPTGAANLASVQAGLRRAGARPILCEDPDAIAAAPRVVLPGVGAFASAIASLRDRGLDRALAQRIQAGAPTLAICLGLQLLGEGSEESPGVDGLGLLPFRARRFTGPIRVPQLGWNEIQTDPGCALLRPGWVYFANSFRVEDCPADWSAARADHGGPFVAAIEKGALLACQFHPELSSDVGLSLLQRWIARSSQEVPAC